MSRPFYKLRRTSWEPPYGYCDYTPRDPAEAATMALASGEAHTYDCKTQPGEGPSWFRQILGAPADTEIACITLKLERPPRCFYYGGLWGEFDQLQCDTAIEEGDPEALLQKEFNDLYMETFDRTYRKEGKGCQVGWAHDYEKRTASFCVRYLDRPRYARESPPYTPRKPRPATAEEMGYY